MDAYFEKLNQMIAEARKAYEADEDKLPSGLSPLFTLAFCGDIDAVFKYAKKERFWRSGYVNEKYYKKQRKTAIKLIKKLHKAKEYLKYSIKFASEDKLIPYVAYNLAHCARKFNDMDHFEYNMQNALHGGDPRAIEEMLEYHTTNEPIGDRYTGKILYNGRFDWVEMMYYAIGGIGFDYTSYYPQGSRDIPEMPYGVDAEDVRKKSYKRLLETLVYFADPDLTGTEDHQKRFGDFVPTEEQIMIARRWFFVEDERLPQDNAVNAYREKVADKLREFLAGNDKKPAKKTTKTVDAAFGTVTVPAEAAANVPKAKKRSEAKQPTEKKSAAPAAPKTEYKRIEMSSGDVYEGGYANGEYHGQGTYTSRKGWVYVGAFDNGVMTDGKLTFTDSGNIFEGHFENGALHGKGKATYYVKVDGKYEYDGEYEGDWVKGKRHGKGKRMYYNGNVYEGDWKEDKRDGYGKFERYTDKLQTKHFRDLVYEGQWNGDKKHGKGVEKHYMPGVNQDVTVYEGEWVNGNREGIFVWYLFYPAIGKESSKDMQYYQNGKVVIESIPYDASIKTYEDFASAKAKLDAKKSAPKVPAERASTTNSPLRSEGKTRKHISMLKCSYYPVMDRISLSVNGKNIQLVEGNSAQTGWGRWKARNGSRYGGTFKNGKFNGMGHYRFSNGKWYAGEFLDNQFHGYGIYYDKKNYHFGRFENGVCITERHFVRAIGQKPDFKNEDGSEIYYCGNTQIIIDKHGIGMIEHRNTDAAWKCTYSFDDYIMAMGKCPNGSITDKNSVILVANPKKHEEIRLEIGEMKNDENAGKCVVKLSSGSIIEALWYGADDFKVLSKTDWAGRRIN